jgi:uncharacterized membrane protein HdeD (DUF308 family)
MEGTMTIHSHSFATAPAQQPGSDSRPLLHALASRWWLVLLRGVAGIVFGVMALVWPGITLLTLVLLYGAYALVDGVLALAAAITRRHGSQPTWWLLLVGLCGIVAGLTIFLWPGMSALVLIIFVGAWAIVHGIFEIIGAIRLRHEIDNEWLLILAGVLSVVFGVLALMVPGLAGLALAWVIGAYAIVFGGTLVALSLRLRKHNTSDRHAGP